MRLRTSAFALCLLASPSHAQPTVCSTDSGGAVETCIANVLRIPAADRVVCARSEAESNAAAESRLASDEQDKAAARVRVAEARLEDSEQAVPADHPDLDENFDAARSRTAAEKTLERQPRVSAAAPTCSETAPGTPPVNKQDTVEITFDAPDHCLQALQRSLEGELRIAVQIVGRQDLRRATARLVNVATVIEHGLSTARGRATLDDPQGMVFDDDTVVVHLQCR